MVHAFVKLAFVKNLYNYEQNPRLRQHVLVIAFFWQSVDLWQVWKMEEECAKTKTSRARGITSDGANFHSLSNISSHAPSIFISEGWNLFYGKLTVDSPQLHIALPLSYKQSAVTFNS